MRDDIRIVWEGRAAGPARKGDSPGDPGRLRWRGESPDAPGRAPWIRAGQAPRGAGGFSLLEVMVAVSILAIALMGILSLYINTITLSEVNREAQIATYQAQQKLEEIRGMTFTDIPAAYPAGTPVYFAVAGLRAFGSNPQPGSVTIDYANPNLINVTVQVRWDGVRGEGNARFSTMISPP